MIFKEGFWTPARPRRECFSRLARLWKFRSSPEIFAFPHIGTIVQPEEPHLMEGARVPHVAGCDHNFMELERIRAPRVLVCMPLQRSVQPFAVLALTNRL